MGKHREKIDIIAKILFAANQEAGKTQMMYEANLNYDMLKKYLTEIIDDQLISSHDGHHYLVTDKGQAFLEIYKKYSKANKQNERQVQFIVEIRKTLEKLFSG